MSELHTIEIDAHQNIYNGIGGRKIRIEFTLPSYETNNETGILILVPGFGANIDSKVYSKMRDVFAEKYNLIVLQSTYFGDKYMQSSISSNINFNLEEHFNESEIALLNSGQIKLEELIRTKNDSFKMIEKMDESMDEFNDMSFMQSIDLITAIEAVKIVLKENKIVFNENRLIGYGHSQGAYLLHLANKMSNSFSYIIDNSAWIQPVYLTNNRYLSLLFGKAKLFIEFEYLAKDIFKDKKSLNLFEIYKDYPNETQIFSLQGNEDNLVNHEEKIRLINNIKNAEIELVTKGDVDQIKYKSNQHGLDADFLELFAYGLKHEKSNTKNTLERRTSVEIGNFKFAVDYSRGLPIFTMN